jgi:hypothetical protein
MALYIRKRNVHQKRKEKKGSNKDNSGKIKGNNEKTQHRMGHACEYICTFKARSLGPRLKVSLEVQSRAGLDAKYFAK